MNRLFHVAEGFLLGSILGLLLGATLGGSHMVILR
jgi:hypothetical protein